MKTTYRIGLDDLTHNTDEILNILFTNCENLENVVESYEFVQMTLSVYPSGQFTATCRRADTTTFTFTDVDYDEYIIGVLIMDADVGGSNVNKVMTLIQNQFIYVDQKGKTTLLAFIQNSENDHLNKTLTGVKIFDGNFKTPVNVKSIEIDVDDYGRFNKFYNYIYIPILDRYYYIRTATHTTKDFTRLYLSEDVLMSWRGLIKSQDALVTRYEGSDNNNLVDNRQPLNDIPSIAYRIPTNVSGSNVIAFDYDPSGSLGAQHPNIIIKTKSETLTFLQNYPDITPPSNTNLPTISNKRTGFDHYYLCNYDDYGGLIRACLKNDAPSTYIHSVILLPFDLSTIFTNSANLRNSNMLAGKWGLDNDGGIVWKESLSSLAPTFPETSEGAPYILVADFWFNASGNIPLTNNYLDYSPNTQWEIYIPFVGWVTLDPCTVIGCRIMVYFTFDMDTGLSTCYIYNATEQNIIWSASCQIGMKLSIAVSNAEELAREKQATSLNLIMGLMTSMVSMGVGGATANPVAMVGGIMGTGKTITNAVNSFNSMIEKAQITYGSSDTALYSPDKIVIRKTTHTRILTTVDEQNRYKHINGYPYNKYVNLGSLNSDNYIEVGEIHFNPKGNEIYQDEINDIVALLKGGVIL